MIKTTTAEEYTKLKEEGHFTKLKDMNKKECKFCKELFHSHNVKGHEKVCRDNPEHLVKKRRTKLDLSGLSYEEINEKYTKCEFCNQLYDKRGIYKHKAYCSENPNGKDKYQNKHLWKCSFCDSLLDSETALKKHRPRCEKNPSVVAFDIVDEQRGKKSNFEIMESLKREFPMIYRILSDNQIRKFLDSKEEMSFIIMENINIIERRKQFKDFNKSKLKKPKEKLPLECKIVLLKEVKRLTKVLKRLNRNE